MSTLRLRTDLERVSLGDFKLPLGLDPADARPPNIGYAVTYNTGEGDDPDTYSFHVVVSHPRVAHVLRRLFRFLPGLVTPILEIDSLDAYRTVDVYLGRDDDPVPIDEFLATWQQIEPWLLEDGAVGAGANSEEPFIEIFLDQWKGVFIHVPADHRESIEQALKELGLEEVAETWPAPPNENGSDVTIRPVLDLDHEDSLAIEDILVELRRRWRLELNIDPERNLDQGGRELGMTLWFAELLVHDQSADDPEQLALMQVWASASSLAELERLIDAFLEKDNRWTFHEWFTVSRVPYDDRPEQLNDLLPRRTEAGLHMLNVSIAAPPDETEGEHGSEPESEDSENA